MTDQRDARAEFDPKHRIIGAIVIVALAVVLVPLILRHREPTPPASAGAVAASTSPYPQAMPSGAASTVAVTPVPPTAPGSSMALPLQSPPAAAIAAAAPPPVAVRRSPRAARLSARPVRRVARRSARKPASGWIVQVGTFSNAGNVSRLTRTLRRHGHAVHAQRVEIAGRRKAVRLRLGPFRDRSQALRVRAQVLREARVQAVVLAYP